MKEIRRQARVHWAGDLKNGRGQITTQSKTLNGAMYSLSSRFEQGAGTDPEELIAAAHASCFSMMLAKILGDQKKSVEEINTDATVVMQFDQGRPAISEVHLKTEARVAGMDAEEFKKAAEQAKESCPVSVLLKPGLRKMTIEIKLL